MDGGLNERTSNEVNSNSMRCEEKLDCRQCQDTSLKGVEQFIFPLFVETVIGNELIVRSIRNFSSLKRWILSGFLEEDRAYDTAFCKVPAGITFCTSFIRIRGPIG